MEIGKDPIPSSLPFNDLSTAFISSSNPPSPLNWSLVKDQFDLDELGGFVSVCKEPTKRLSTPYEPWEIIADDLVSFTLMDKLRSLVDNLPLIDVKPLFSNDSDCQRALLLLTCITHCYVRGNLIQAAKDVKRNMHLPFQLATPLLVLADWMGLKPICSFASTVLYNWRLLNPFDRFNVLENCYTSLVCSGCPDESWFFLIQLAIEASSANIIKVILNIQKKPSSQDLQSLRQQIEEITEILSRMYLHCRPFIFYHKVRPYLSGWKNDSEQQVDQGIWYGLELESRKLAGGSAAQSSLIQVLDISLNIHHEGSHGEYLREMRKYMPRKHRKFLEWLQENVNLKVAIENDSELQPLLEDCISALNVFRRKHLTMVQTYVIKEAQREKLDNKEIYGTGGSSPMEFLNQVIEDTKLN